jgi:1,4-alpha-glucan branching enzyme
MPASQLHLTVDTPLGATLIAGGATFRCWAPNAEAVYVAFPPHPAGVWPKPDAQLLVRDAQGIWGGFFAGVKDGDAYRFYVVGTGSEGFKRDPYARELAPDAYPRCDCIVRDPSAYPWHDDEALPPAFSNLVVYQFHFGVFFAEDELGRDIRPHRVCKFLDAVGRIEYWAELGINAVMPLPFQEFQTASSLGYNGTDLFSPEMDYAVRATELPPYLERVNRLLAKKGHAPLELAQLVGQDNQLKAFIDLCHVYGIAVIADVVFNHAGGGFDDQSIYFFDRQPTGDNARSLYFTRSGHAGGLVFDYEEPQVRRFLLDNALSLLGEYHVDGLRYDQVSVMVENGGWSFCQQLTRTVREHKPGALQLAEYWADEPWKALADPPWGMGFDAGYSDELRQAIRSVIEGAAHGADSALDLPRLSSALTATHRLPGRWTTFQCIENHDLLDFNHDDKQPRIAKLADPTNARSWYARSRARVANALLLTAPGIPMLFMGQELLEDKYWTDWQGRPELLIWWEGLAGADRHVGDFQRFVRDLLELRRAQPALRADGINVYHVDQAERVLALHRFAPSGGNDVVVVMNLNESTFHGGSYQLGFPAPGRWREVFNSDVYDNFPNPVVEGNKGAVTAHNDALGDMPASAGLTLPANAVLVFAR